MSKECQESIKEAVLWILGYKVSIKIFMSIFFNSPGYKMWVRGVKTFCPDLQHEQKCENMDDKFFKDQYTELYQGYKTVIFPAMMGMWVLLGLAASLGWQCFVITYIGLQIFGYYYDRGIRYV
jgi:hypothetical protein